MIPKRETPQAVEEHDTAKAKYGRFLGPALLGVVMAVALCAFIPALAFLTVLPYGERWEVVTGFGVFVLASFALAMMIPILLPKRKGGWRERQYGWPEWSLMGYFFIIGLGFNWACAFLWFSRRYDFFSTPVIAATGLIMAFYAAIALLMAWLDSLFNNADSTGVSWRTALLIFVFAPGVLASIVLRLGLLR
jgi:hypothetical protein